MKIFVLHHVHHVTSEQEDVKLTGIYSTRERAEEAQRRMIELPGFRDAPDDFHIDEYEVDADHWTEGYETFISYVGPQALHDATLLRLKHKDNWVKVYLKSNEGHFFTLEFLDVIDIQTIQPEGMRLYALAEFKDKSPFRRFVFSNWNEEANAMLEIVARDFQVLEEVD